MELYRAKATITKTEIETHGGSVVGDWHARITLTVNDEFTERLDNDQISMKVPPHRSTLFSAGRELEVLLVSPGEMLASDVKADVPSLADEIRDSRAAQEIRADERRKLAEKANSIPGAPSYWDAFALVFGEEYNRDAGYARAKKLDNLFEAFRCWGTAVDNRHHEDGLLEAEEALRQAFMSFHDSLNVKDEAQSATSPKPVTGWWRAPNGDIYRICAPYESLDNDDAAYFNKTVGVFASELPAGTVPISPFVAAKSEAQR